MTANSTQGPRPLIGIVGVCGSGKTTLVGHLEKQGVSCRAIAQEHSYVPDMWLRLTCPQHLVYLEVTYQNATRRRRLSWSSSEYDEQVHRLRHAFAHADLVIDTNLHSPRQVADIVMRSFVPSRHSTAKLSSL